nr:MAG TPA: hypothetical protein [Caudoviricetes sp.]
MPVSQHTLLKFCIHNSIKYFILHKPHKKC